MSDTKNESKTAEWRKERLYGERDTVLWAILAGQTVIGSALVEADADRIIADHQNAPDLLESLETLVAMCDGIRPDWSNGVTNNTGDMDEGRVLAGRYIQEARAVIRAARGAS